MEYLLFRTLEESENYWSTMSIEEKKKKIGFGLQKDPLTTNYSIWGAPTVEFLRILLCDLYQIRDIYLRYDSLNQLEKHGLAHIIISATSAYIEGKYKHILLAHYSEDNVNKVVFLSISSDCSKAMNRLQIFSMDILRGVKKLEIPDYIKTDTDLKNWLQAEYNTKEIHLFKGVFEKYDPNVIDYFGNYIHPRVKRIISMADTWDQIKCYRNLLAHLQEKINERALKMACETLLSEEFIRRIEGISLWLLSLPPAQQQELVDRLTS